MHTRDKRISIALPQAQQGAAALIMLIVVVLGASYYFLGALNRASSQTERDRITAAALAQAKEAVLGFALANQRMPGGLPFPDRNGDGNYDGSGDCFNGIVNSNLLLGKFPTHIEEGCSPVVAAFGIAAPDGAGEQLWYAASRNLVRSNAGNYPVINTAILMANDNWLVVRDESGALLSSSVAFLLIAPGAVVQGQNRSGSAPAAQNFLDSFTVGAATYQNWNMLNPLGFVAARPVNNATNRFNDRLLYVTRDELVNRLVDRVAGEIRSRLDQYHLAHNAFPFAAPLLDGNCDNTTNSGFIPIADGNCVASLAVFPAWWTLHEWQNVTDYAQKSANKATLQFDLCASVFTFIWNATLNRSETQRSGTC